MTAIWDKETVTALFALPFMELLFKAQTIHRENFNPNEIQLSTLLSIKTGTCPEDCNYCSQSGHFKTGLQKENLYSVDEVIQKAKLAKESGATRFCMGAAWRSPPKKDLPKVLEMISAVKKMGLETCVTLGMLDTEQALALKNAGLDYYNHNLDTSPEYYPSVVTTRTYEDRLQTIKNVGDAGINVCCGGILGMGEQRKDHISLLVELAHLPTQPLSIPINLLVSVKGTPFGDQNLQPLDNFDFIRTVAVARIMFPKSYVRLSAGRTTMSEEMHALCFLAGANSVHFAGEKLLTTPNRDKDQDVLLLKKLGMTVKAMENHVA